MIKVKATTADQNACTLSCTLIKNVDSPRRVDIKVGPSVVTLSGTQNPHYPQRNNVPYPFSVWWAQFLSYSQTDDGKFKSPPFSLVRQGTINQGTQQGILGNCDPVR